MFNKRVVRLFERVHFHEPAFATEAVICRAGNECLVRNFLFQDVQYDRLQLRR